MQSSELANAPAVLIYPRRFASAFLEQRLGSKLYPSSRGRVILRTENRLGSKPYLSSRGRVTRKFAGIYMRIAGALASSEDCKLWLSTLRPFRGTRDANLCEVVSILALPYSYIELIES